MMSVFRNQSFSLLKRVLVVALLTLTILLRVGTMAPQAFASNDDSGYYFQEFPITTVEAYPTKITDGPDNGIWFTESWSNKIGRMDPYSGAITDNFVPTTWGTPHRR